MTMESPLFTQKNKILFFASLTLSLIMLTLVSNKALAIVENDANIPPSVRNAFISNRSCWNAAQNRTEGAYGYLWVSPSGTPSHESMLSLGVGQASLPLQFNYSASVCDSNVNGAGGIQDKSMIMSRTHIEQVTAVVRPHGGGASVGGISVSGVSASYMDMVPAGVGGLCLCK